MTHSCILRNARNDPIISEIRNDIGHTMFESVRFSGISCKTLILFDVDFNWK